MELFPGTDGSIRSAKVKIVNDQGKYGTKVLNQPLQLLVPLTFMHQQQAPVQITQVQPKFISEAPIVKPRHSAAVISDIRRKDGHWK